MKTNRTYNPCDECPYSYSRTGEESSMCKICELTYFISIVPKQCHWTFPDHGGISYYKCSCCGYEIERPLTYTRDDINKYRRYCTYCGAKMFRESSIFSEE